METWMRPVKVFRRHSPCISRYIINLIPTKTTSVTSRFFYVDMRQHSLSVLTPIGHLGRISIFFPPTTLRILRLRCHGTEKIMVKKAFSCFCLLFLFYYEDLKKNTLLTESVRKITVSTNSCIIWKKTQILGVSVQLLYESILKHKNTLL